MNVSRIIISFVAIVGLVAVLAAPVAAVNYGGGSVQAFAATQPLDNGTIVQLTDEEAKRVSPASAAQLEKMFGVVVDRNQLLITSSSELENEAYVAASGTYPVLVNTQGGSIASGDYLTLSTIDGVAMKAKASTEQTMVFGRANEAFDGKSATLGTQQIKDTSGNVVETVSLGIISVTIDVKQNPYDVSTKANLPEFLEQIGKAIADKEVSPLRMYLSIGIMAVSLIAALVMLYAGIRNSVVSIGRNPMSKKSIFKALVQVILTSLLIVIIGMFAVYLLLKL